MEFLRHQESSLIKPQYVQIYGEKVTEQHGKSRAPTVQAREPVNIGKTTTCTASFGTILAQLAPGSS